jgi:hypothetical protein
MIRILTVLVTLVSLFAPVYAENGDHLNVELMSSMTDDWGNITGIQVIDNYGYVNAGVGDIKILDVSIPSNPIEIGALAITGKILINNEFLYNIQNGETVVIYDLTDRLNPIEIGQFTSEEYIYTFEVADNFMYLISSFEGMIIVDISDPSNPIQVGDFPMMDSISGFVVSGDYAYIANYWAVMIVDIEDRMNPVYIGAINAGDFIQGLAVSGDCLCTSSSDTLITFDISDPVNPVLADRYDTGYLIDNIIIADGYAFASGYYWFYDRSEMAIIDVSDPYNISRTDIYQISGNVSEPVVSGDHLFLPNHKNGLLTFDLTNPDEIILSGGYDISYSRNVAVSDSFAYVANGSMGLQILDISDPENPNEVGSYNGGFIAEEIAVDGDYAYIAALSDGLKIIDISDPFNPNEVGSIDTTGSALNVTIEGDMAFVPYDGDGWVNGVRIIDITDPENPSQLGFFRYNNRPMQDVAVNGNIAYVTSQASIQAVSIADPSNPVEIGYLFGNWPTDIVYENGYVYVSDSHFGFRIIDYTSHSNPGMVGHLDYEDDITGIAIDGDYAYITTSASGIRVVDISDPTSPSEVGFYDTEGDALGLDVSGELAYVADGHFFEIFDCSAAYNAVPPDPFDLLTPIDNTRFEGGDDVELTWSASSDDVYEYLVCYTTHNDFDWGYDSVAVVDTNYTILNIEDERTFKWKVLARNETTSGRWSTQTFEMTTRDPVAPLPFDLRMPADSVIVEAFPCEFSWDMTMDRDADGWVNFQLEISASDTFDVSETTYYHSGIHTSYDVSNLENGEYWWRVLAIDDNTEGTYSTTSRYFQVDVASEVDDENIDIPTEFAITSAYPNPFNPTLNIKIALPETSDLDVMIFNVMGQSVATLSNDGQYAAGIHGFTFDGSDLSSGVYFIHATTPNHMNQIQKVVLMK